MMVRLAGLIWMIVGTAFAGIAIMVVVATPSLAIHDVKYIPYAAVAGFIVAIPVAFMIARQIGKATAR
jgi:hypothetical protein